MGVFIVGGTVALGVVLVQRMNSKATGLMGAEWLLEGQPAGSRITSLATAEGGLAVLVQRPDGERVLLLDPRRRQVIGEIRLKP